MKEFANRKEKQNSEATDPISTFGQIAATLFSAALSRCLASTTPSSTFSSTKALTLTNYVLVHLQLEHYLNETNANVDKKEICANYCH